MLFAFDSQNSLKFQYHNWIYLRNEPWFYFGSCLYYCSYLGGKSSVFPLFQIKVTVVLINENALDVIQSLVTVGRRPNQTEP